METIHYHLKHGDLICRGSCDFQEADYLVKMYKKMGISFDMVPCLDYWSCPPLVTPWGYAAQDGWQWNQIEDHYIVR